MNTPRLITNQAQQAVWRWDQAEPFGTYPANENPSGLGVFEFNKRFEGQYFDKETGLHYNYWRDCYDPAIGRYCQSDPIGLDGGLNTYSYAAANPLSNTDPEGTIIVPALVGAVALIGGTVAGTKIAEIGIGEALKAQNRRQVEEIKQLQENILLPACFNGSQAACNEVVRLEQLKQACYGSTVNLSAPQSNTSSGGFPMQIGKSILKLLGLGR